MKHGTASQYPSDGQVRKTRKKLTKGKRAELYGEAHSHGHAIGRKRKCNKSRKAAASLSCPYCGNRVREDLIRLRQDLFECRLCNTLFIKENVIDEFDFDGLDEGGIYGR